MYANFSNFGIALSKEKAIQKSYRASALLFVWLNVIKYRDSFIFYNVVKNFIIW